MFVLGIGLGFVIGVVATLFLGMFAIDWEWNERQKIDRRLQYLEKNLCCGKGVFGCDGGPNCFWDHK